MRTISVSYARNQSRRERTLAVYADGVVYKIDTAEKKGITLDDLIKRASCAATESVTVNGIVGRSCKSDDADTVMIGQFFATTTNLYAFAAVGSKLRDYSAAMAKFFSSVSFHDNSEGKVIENGPGDQPVSHLNGAQTDLIVKSRETTTKARVISKPEPMYTEQARRNQTTGTVVLRCIFSMSGAVEDIGVLKDLPDGLTDRAIDAARQIRFIPAVKDGHFVSTWIQLEYNFNLY
jgi:TonB family protein